LPSSGAIRHRRLRSVQTSPFVLLFGDARPTVTAIFKIASVARNERQA
jgi:hypothetical protein